MKIINLETKKELKYKKETLSSLNAGYFILCNPHDMLTLQPHYNFDKGTVMECINLDESVRFSSFDGYDFISFIYFWIENESIKSCEINLYIANNFLILVVPETNISQCLDKLIHELYDKILNITTLIGIINRVYYLIFDSFISDFSSTLEKTEDAINAVELAMQKEINKQQFNQAASIKEGIYLIKKHIRPLLYISDQFLVDENKFIGRDNLKYFKNLDIRINELYDFAVNLQDYANQTLYSYDSRMTIQTNEIVNKLTVIMLFMGPLTIIAGIYGMNFRHMPELSWYYGYPFSIGLMILVSVIIYAILKVKKWL